MSPARGGAGTRGWRGIACIALARPDHEGRVLYDRSLVGSDSAPPAIPCAAMYDQCLLDARAAAKAQLRGVLAERRRVEKKERARLTQLAQVRDDVMSVVLLMLVWTSPET